MDGREWLAERFEENRGHLRAVAYRMLGSVSEADDAVQETWLRLSRTDADEIENLSGWLTTVVARVCLDMLRSRTSRREEPLETSAPEHMAETTAKSDPERDAVLADSVGLAVLVVLDRLNPAERLAFVLHDMFAVSFEEIANIIGRSPEAARQLASRARRRVQGTKVSDSARSEQGEVVQAFLSALRAGDVEGLIAVLDPEVVVRIDTAAARPGAPREIHGAANWARGAVAFAQAVRFAQPALIDGAVGLIFAPGGRLSRVLQFTTAAGKITKADIIADPARLRELTIAVLGESLRNSGLSGGS
jgi:RNA polymerase sigma-70 factor (ECF subfamily)